MTLDSNTLLVISLAITFIATFVWFLAAFVFKANPSTSSQYALANLILGCFVYFYVLRNSHPTVMVYFLSDVCAMTGAMFLRRAIQDFAELKKSDKESLIILLCAGIVDYYFRSIDIKLISVGITCFFTGYFFASAAFIGYKDLIKNFNLKFSLIIIFPLCLMAALLLYRAALAFYNSNTVIDLREVSAMNSSFLIGVLVTILGYNITGIGLLVSRMITRINRLSQEDPLTHVFNRRHLNTLAEAEIVKSQKTKKPFSVIALDVDHFKKVNDIYGHAAGDEALISCVNIIKNNIRSSDNIGRLGGEEFCILLPNTNIDEAKTLAERIRTNIEKTPVQWQDKNIPITASFGITTIDLEENSSNEWSELLSKADIAMYQAKHNGRNQVALNYCGW